MNRELVAILFACVCENVTSPQRFHVYLVYFKIISKACRLCISSIVKSLPHWFWCLQGQAQGKISAYVFHYNQNQRNRCIFFSLRHWTKTEWISYSTSLEEITINMSRDLSKQDHYVIFYNYNDAILYVQLVSWSLGFCQIHIHYSSGDLSSSMMNQWMIKHKAKGTQPDHYKPTPVTHSPCCAE